MSGATINYQLIQMDSPPLKKSSTLRKLVVRDCHPWGCLVYILTDKLQGPGAKIPKWNPRARLGIYLWRSLLIPGIFSP